MKEDKTCKICGKTFTRRNYMQKHMEHIHSKRYSCPKCSRFFSGPTEHSCAIENGRFLCYVRDCPLRFSNGMAMRLHIRDCHRKIDEEGVSRVMKTKKGIQELVQTLCKKINLLSNCFDELKYQVDSITSFLHSKGFGFENVLPIVSPVTMSNEAEMEVHSELETKEEYEDIDYIDEEYEDEDIATIEEFQGDDTMLLDDYDEFEPKPKLEANNEPTYILSTNETCIADRTVEIHSPTVTESKPMMMSKSAFTMPINIPTQTPTPIIIKRNAHAIPIPQTTTRGSTIITQIPANLVQFESMPVRKNSVLTSATNVTNLPTTKRKVTSTATKPMKNESPTPPLFLKIQYDTETAICETDPKITFHFDTKPPDEIQDEFL